VTSWWDERSPRERWLATAALAALLATIAAIVVGAVRDDLAGLRDRVAAQERTLAHVRGLAAELTRAAPAGDGDALLARLETAADAIVGRARIASMTPLDGIDVAGAREERVAVRLAAASLGETVRLLHALAAADPPLPVVRLDLRKHPDDPRHFDATIEVSRLVAR
jgi:hypothetical protein